MLVWNLINNICYSFFFFLNLINRGKEGLAVFLPSSGKPMDLYYANNSEKMVAPQVESVAFNADYPNICSKRKKHAWIHSEKYLFLSDLLKFGFLLPAEKHLACAAAERTLTACYTHTLIFYSLLFSSSFRETSCVCCGRAYTAGGCASTERAIWSGGRWAGARDGRFEGRCYKQSWQWKLNRARPTRGRGGGEGYSCIVELIWIMAGDNFTLIV